MTRSYMGLDVWFKHRNDRSTIAFVDYYGVIGKGVAKLMPGDHYNQQVGEEIALGRALIDIGIKQQNKWLLRSRTEAEIKAQRAAKNRINVTIAADASELRLALNEFKEVINVANRPVKEKARKSSKPHAKKNLSTRE